MFYEVQGEGSPLVLLHGGVQSIDLSFAGLIPELVGRHRVIGVELQGHGRTADIDRTSTRPRWPATWSRYSTLLLNGTR